MAYAICVGCNRLIRDTVYQVGEEYFHETCRPSYQRENWKYIVEHSENVRQLGGLEAWRRDDWDVLEIGTDARRRAKVSGLKTIPEIRDALEGFGKPVCQHCELYVWPWESFHEEEQGKLYHDSCVKITVMEG